MSYTPSLEEVISQAIDDHLIDLHTSIPAIIESYDNTNQTATVKIAIKRKYINGDVEEIIERPAIPDVPVLFPRGGSFHLTYPLKKGDDVHLIISERSTERWRNEKGVVDPKDARKFSLSDAFILPVSGRENNPIAGATSDKIRLVNGLGEIEINENGEIIVKSTGQRIFLQNGIASVELQAAGLIELKNASGKIRITADGKFKVEGTEELLTIINDLIVAMENATTLTALGPQPFFPPTLVTLGLIKTRLLAIKE